MGRLNVQSDFFHPGPFSFRRALTVTLLCCCRHRNHADTLCAHTKLTKGPLTGPTSPQATKKQANMIFIMFFSIGVPVFWLHTVDHCLTPSTWNFMFPCFWNFFNIGNKIKKVISAECNLRLALSALVGFIKFKAHEESTQGETDKSVLSVSTA